MPEQHPRWPADPQFGDLFAALHPPRFLAAARAQAANGGIRRDTDWRHCRVIEALYDPGAQVRVAYALMAEDLPHSRLWPAGDLFYARFPVRRPMSRRGFLLEVEGHELEVYRFPNDRRLRGLRRFSARERAARVWQSWLDDDEPGLRLQPETLRRGLLRYVPEQKWIIHLHAQCVDGGGQRSKRAVAVRSSDVRDGRRLYDRTQALRRVRGKYDGAFRIPKPLAFDDKLGLLAMRWAWGPSLLELLHTADSAGVLDHVATGLNALHHMPLPGLPTVTPEDYLASAEACAGDLKKVLPEQGPAIEALLLDLRRLCPEDAGRHVTVHNDFHWNQFRGKPDRLTILDLERCAVGDPAIDVATFTIQLVMLASRRGMGVTAQQAREWAESFLKSWELRSGRPPELDRIRWHAAVALLVLARGQMRHLRMDWSELVGACLELAGQQMASTELELVRR